MNTLRHKMRDLYPEHTYYIATTHPLWVYYHNALGRAVHRRDELLQRKENSLSGWKRYFPVVSKYFFTTADQQRLDDTERSIEGLKDVLREYDELNSR